MRAGNISGWKVRLYTDLARSAVRLGVNIEDLISETKKFHGIEFGNQVEKMMKGTADFI
jgi:hypothetical protein